MYRLTALALCASLAACATNPAAPDAPPTAVAQKPTPLPLTPPPAPAPPPSSTAGFDARAFAAQHVTPGECESAARLYREQSPDLGWAALRGCADRASFPRGEFTNLKFLLNGAWDDDLRTRPDAGKLIAHFVALRGGDVEGDVDSFQRKQIPVFTLSAAMKQPEVYKGRLLIVRAHIQDLKTDQNQQVAVLAERSVRAVDYNVAGKDSYTYSSDSSYSSAGSGEVSGSYSGSRGSGSGSSSGSGQYAGQSSSTSTYTTYHRKSENAAAPTGREGLGRLVKADPFLNPDKDFVFLVRFDGVRNRPDNRAPIALMTVMSYFPPNALMVE